MKKIGFIGALDKIDNILYIAKIIKELGYKVLVIDATRIQKAKYVVPTIKPTRSYITNFEGVDVAVGFFEKNQIDEYIGIGEKWERQYDYILLNIDSKKVCLKFDIYSCAINYFVTAFDLYSLKRGVEIISGLNRKINLKKVIFSDKDNNKSDNEYLDYLSKDSLIKWVKPEIYFPLQIEDLITIADNYRVEKIKFKKISQQYKSSLACIVEEICNQTDSLEIFKVLKKIERGA